MKKIIVLYTLLALIGCTNIISEEPGNGTNTGAPISFGAGVAAITSRAPIESDPVTNIVSQDIFGIQIIREDGGTTPFASGIPASRTTADIKNGRTDMILGQRQYFNIGSLDDAHFMAYYPAGSLSSGKVTYPMDGKLDIITANLRTAKFGPPLEDVVDFKFEHKLTRVKLVVDSSDEGAVKAFGALKSASIKVTPTELELSISGSGTNLDFDLNIKTNGPSKSNELFFITNGDTPKTLEGTEKQHIGDIMIYPGEIPDNITLEFTGNRKESYPLTWVESSPPGNLLKEGTTNTITITLDANRIVLGTGALELGKGEEPQKPGGGSGNEVEIKPKN